MLPLWPVWCLMGNQLLTSRMLPRIGIASSWLPSRPRISSSSTWLRCIAGDYLGCNGLWMYPIWSRCSQMCGLTPSIWCEAFRSVALSSALPITVLLWPPLWTRCVYRCSTGLGGSVHSHCFVLLHTEYFSIFPANSTLQVFLKGGAGDPHNWGPPINLKWDSKGTSLNDH